MTVTMWFTGSSPDGRRAWQSHCFVSSTGRRFQVTLVRDFMSLALTGPLTGSRLVPGQPELPATFVDLPFAARAFFALVMAAGGGALLLQTSASYSHWPVFLALLAGASGAALFRVDLPFSLQGATMSLSFAFAFAGLLLLGPHPTLIIAAVAAWVQSTVNVSARTPLHRTAFSMAAAGGNRQGVGVGVSRSGRRGGVLGAGVDRAGEGHPRRGAHLLRVEHAHSPPSRCPSPAASRWPRCGTNTPCGVRSATSSAAALRRPPRCCWRATAPGSLRLLVGPLYLTHRTYRVYSDRVEHERRRAGEMSRRAPGDDRSAGARH